MSLMNLRVRHGNCLLIEIDFDKFFGQTQFIAQFRVCPVYGGTSPELTSGRTTILLGLRRRWCTIRDY